MSIEIIGVLTLAVGLTAVSKSPSFGFTFLLCSMLLGAAAAFLVPGLGTIQPPHVLLLFIGLLVLRHRVLTTAAIDSMRVFSPGFFLACVCIYALLTGYFLPRIFAGQVEINALNTPEYVEYNFPIALKPTNGNITQSVYMICDIVCFALFSGFTSTSIGRLAIARAFLIYGAANIAFAAIDLLTSSLGVSWALDFIRNATYVIYEDSTIGEARRIIGSFTEASAFAFATLGVTCFAFRLWLGGVYTKSSLSIGVISLILLLASTSSTAYVALGPPMAFLVVGSFVRVLSDKATAQDAALLMFTPLVVAACALVVGLDHDLHIFVRDYLDSVVFSKSLSASGIERARLNQDAISAFLQTNFWGVGLGSVRTSSFVTASLASLGLVGTALFSAFFATLMLQADANETPATRVIRSASKFGCFGLLSAATASGALTDLGLPFFALAALASAKERSSVETGVGAPETDPQQGIGGIPT